MAHLNHVLENQSGAKHWSYDRAGAKGPLNSFCPACAMFKLHFPAANPPRPTSPDQYWGGTGFQPCLNLKRVHALAMCLLSQAVTASISQPKHFAHTPRPTTCVAFSSLLTLDTVTDGQGSKLSQRAPSRNSTECQKTSHRSTEEAERLHLLNIIARRVRCLHWEPHTCWCPTLRQKIPAARAVSYQRCVQ